ncbi:NHL repeat-containing protein [Actimicrobium sp. CCC2.4]|uniref:NHL repeat-containing protein n=1 Tax=Actimicrobium sp. CCC2.4 TaxID=3048606 RepID=UPI002AC94C14|nr:NHL repeat-containing protein [Actimicrobium sp. CCC2.4]MEB0136430.1 NHL repeat-containing protein [Actimicrobium sp. CCC2.4]WPX31249.1 NHL repeat-containing protein [Actimicrobium sp. CCC2.4]
MARSLPPVLLCLLLLACSADFDPLALLASETTPVLRQSAIAATMPASAPSAQPGLFFVAGSTGGAGNLSGSGSQARFNFPVGIAVDGAGNRYVADWQNHVIRKVSADGSVSTLAGAMSIPGAADGTGAAARFNYPQSIAIDRAGTLYVADTNNQTIRKVTAQGVVTTIAGRVGVDGSTDGRANAARFSYPQGIAIDVAGTVLVSDTYNHTVRTISPGGMVATLAGSAGNFGVLDGVRSAARFSNPQGLVTDAARNIYVADAGSGLLRKITPAGIVTTLAGSLANFELKDGTGAAAGFEGLSNLAIDSAGILYGADQYARRIRRITPQGVVTTLPVNALAAIHPQVTMPLGIAVDPSGALSVTGQYGVHVITGGTTLKTLAGKELVRGIVNGSGAKARFGSLQGVTSDASGNWYVVDTPHHMIRKITPAGVVSQLAGNGKPGGVDGTGAAASFNYPRGIVADALGNLFVADTFNSTIRKITPAGVVTTIAGAGSSPGSADGPGNVARFFEPEAIAIDAARNLFVADTGNHTVRKITVAGVVSTLAGSAGKYGSDDGTGAAARFLKPPGIAVDPSGNVVVSQPAYGTIRKITPGGVVTTLAGRVLETGALDGAGDAARFFNPQGLAADNAGNVYVADAGNNTIRRITPSGQVSTVAGVPGSVGIRTGALPGSLAQPMALALAGATTLAVINENAVLRLVLPK